MRIQAFIVFFLLIGLNISLGFHEPICTFEKASSEVSEVDLDGSGKYIAYYVKNLGVQVHRRETENYVLIQ